MSDPTRIESLELEIDERMPDLRVELLKLDRQRALSVEVVASLMRAAYGKGYIDACREEDQGAFARRHGYKVPPRSARAGEGSIT